jgi:tRNA dimethylallyltransferase
MDIGTDKVPLEIRKKTCPAVSVSRVPHHQIDIIQPDERYTAGQRQRDTKRIIKEIQKRNKLPMIVG